MERTELPIEELTVDPLQARDEPWANDTLDRRLSASVASDGVLQDLLVRPVTEVQTSEELSGADDEGPSYAIIAGSRRYHAAMDAGYETVPCKILDADDLNAAWLSLLENTDTKDLSEQEVAQQLRVIYEFVRPRSEPEACPQCGTPVDGEDGLHAHYGHSDCESVSVTEDADETDPLEMLTSEQRFRTERQAKGYLAQRLLGRDDQHARKEITGYLQTASLPQPLQALFKSPSERTATEETTLDNYGIDTSATLGSGEGRSGTSREVTALYNAVTEDTQSEALDPTDAVLEAVGSLRHDEMSELEFRRTLREFRHDFTDEVATVTSAAEQRQQFTDLLQTRVADLREDRETVDPERPFTRVDVQGPQTQQHSRWHVRVKARRDVARHGDLVRELYQERLETLAEEEGWQ